MMRDSRFIETPRVRRSGESLAAASDAIVHVLELEQRIVRPAWIAERCIVRAIDEDLAVAVLRARSWSWDCG